jgi:GTP cyclohydrolase II
MNEVMVTRQVAARIPNDLGEFKLLLYTTNLDAKEHLALIYGEVEDQADVLVRVHSECFTGDVFGSRRCDCGEQLRQAMEQITSAGQGVIIYLRQEGRGIGLLNKLHAYNLQDMGFDTVEANLMLGHGADERDYTVAARILEDLRIPSVRLITNNPSKIEHLKDLGIKITDRAPQSPTIFADNLGYLITKVQRMDHLLNLAPFQVEPSESIASRNGTD